jgi:TRAP-type C4-dicarboxylate transport system permease small subunit
MHSVMMGLSRGLAMIGGIVLSALILMTCISILGRHASTALNSDMMQNFAPALANWLSGLGIGPIYGDFELTELGMGFAVFCFLPLCQITSGHARVDIFTAFLSDTINRWLRLIIETIFLGAIALIAWRLSIGMSSRMRTGQTTYLLEWPVWWPYAACMVAASGAVIVAVYMVYIRVLEAVGGKDIIGEGGESEH